jgi:hypothetical protein
VACFVASAKVAGRMELKENTEKNTGGNTKRGRESRQKEQQ